MSGPFEIIEQLSGPALQQRRDEVAAAYIKNETGPRSNLTSIEEAYYYVPVHLALQLQEAGHYDAALNYFRTVYDYSAPTDLKKIYFGLTEEQYLPLVYQRGKNWLLDPLNPHEIAATRENTNTRFIKLSLARCFLDYADAEFTRDTAESVPRARTLYMTALEILDQPEIKQTLDVCATLIQEALASGAGDGEATWGRYLVEYQLGGIKNRRVLEETLAAVSQVLAMDATWDTRFAAAHAIVADAKSKEPPPVSIKALRKEKGRVLERAHSAVLADGATAEAASAVGMLAAKDLLLSVSRASRHRAEMLAGGDVAISWLRLPGGPGRAGSSAPGSNPGPAMEILSESPEASHYARGMPGTPGFAPSLGFCIPPNPVIEQLRLQAELSLYKIRTCRNIAGIERQLEPYAAPTDTVSGLPQIGPGGQLVLPGPVTLKPTPYRSSVLMERAKRHVELAAQMESAMLLAIEKYEAGQFQVLTARNDIRLANAGVRLSELRVREAESARELATLQQRRAQIEKDTYEEWINADLNDYEKEMLDAFDAGAEAQIAASFFQAGIDTASAGPAAGAVAVMAQGKYWFTTQAVEATRKAERAAFYASHERRKQQWELQKALAEQDIAIASQQYKIADDHVRVAGQERKIAQMQADHARDVMEFLANKFTSPELYAWMARVYETVSRYFLQLGTATAQAWAQQLAFERQEAPPPFIQADYWEAPAETLGAGNTDRRGLTGSARLLQDIYKLDQYAFETDKRKLQLTKTISLAQLSPVEFQRFRETGVINFATPMELFDRDFPGHYLRLIKRVRSSVIALIPPTEGIHATLSTTGLSRVVIGSNGLYQTVLVKRPPESVALTSPFSASGSFEPTSQPGEMLLAFEGVGVDTNWELRMPRASNQFDYSTIVDDLITIDYTALDSFDYRQQVIQQLDTDFSADRPFSFRHEFADPWYDLHNPEQTATPMVVRFNTRREDFPPNLDDLKIQQVVLYFARKDGAPFEMPAHLQFTAQDGGGTVGGGSTSADGVISTRKGNAGSWTAMLGKSPIGEWELALPDTPMIKNRFKEEQIEDMLFVITYKGHTPAWPA